MGTRTNPDRTLGNLGALSCLPVATRDLHEGEVMSEVWVPVPGGGNPSDDDDWDEDDDDFDDDDGTADDYVFLIEVVG
jgi:hypothetical protein